MNLSTPVGSTWTNTILFILDAIGTLSFYAFICVTEVILLLFMNPKIANNKPRTHTRTYLYKALLADFIYMPE